MQQPGEFADSENLSRVLERGESFLGTFLKAARKHALML
jgi:hypothetical protein